MVFYDIIIRFPGTLSSSGRVQTKLVSVASSMHFVIALQMSEAMLHTMQEPQETEQARNWARNAHDPVTAWLGRLQRTSQRNSWT